MSTGHVAGLAIRNSELFAAARHYGVSVHSCVPADPQSNAVAEAFFATLKNELDRRHFATRADARQAIFAWINYYTHARLHSACGHRPPAEYEHMLTSGQPVASTLAA